MTSFVQSLDDTALAALSGGTNSFVQQFVSGLLPFAPGPELPPDGRPASALPDGLNPGTFGPGPAILPHGGSFAG